MTTSAAWIRATYRVPARRGMRITWREDGRPAKQATIVGFLNGRLRIRFDGDTHIVSAHPTYAITYPDLDAELAGHFTPAERLALARRDETLTQILERSDWDKYVVERAVFHIGLHHDEFSANTVRGRLPEQGRGFLGAAMNALHGAGLIEHTGQMVPSDLEGTNAHRISCWRLSIKGLLIAQRRDNTAAGQMGEAA